MDAIRVPRRLDHIVHAVDDLERAAAAYSELGFTVTPRADHPFGTSNRLVVLPGPYVEIVAVTRPERLPLRGFAARVARHLLHVGPGISHLVLGSDDPEAERDALGDLATGEIFSFSRPAPQVQGQDLTATFACVLLHEPSDLGLFLCHHRSPEAVWNAASTTHINDATRVISVDVPVVGATMATLAAAADADLDRGQVQLAGVSVFSGGPSIHFDATVPPTTVEGVRISGRQDH